MYDILIISLCIKNINEMYDLLPERLEEDTSTLMRLLALSREALAVPDEEKTFWDVMCASSIMTAQSRGVIVEKAVTRHFCGTSVPAGADRGDFAVGNRHYEVKSGFTKGRVNIRQIRPWQDVDYIILHVDVENKPASRLYRLTHEEMMSEVGMIGSLSHGTKSAGLNNGSKEFSITLTKSEGNEAYDRWEREYRRMDEEKTLFGHVQDGQGDFTPVKEIVSMREL